MNELSQKNIVSEIANIIAFHKDKLIENIRVLGYVLPNNLDKTIASFVAEKAGSDIRVAQMLGQMIYDINFEKQSNIIGIDTIIGGVGSIVGGITGVYSAKEGVKGAKETTKQTELLLEIEKQRTEQAKALASQGGKKMSTGVKIGIIGGGAVLLTVILVLVFRKRNVQA